MRWLAVLAVLVGCDTVLRIDTIHPPPDAPLCTPPAVSDDFSAATPVCGTWGTMYGTASTITRQPNQLVITPLVVASGSFDACNSLPFELGPSGVFVQLGHVPGNSSYGVLEILTYAATTDRVPNADTTFAFSQGAFDYYDQTTCSMGSCQSIHSSAYFPTQMRWMRIVPDAGKTALIAQTSPDGITWNDFATRDISPAIANYVAVTLGAGSSGTMASDASIFESFDICQVP